MTGTVRDAGRAPSRLAEAVRFGIAGAANTVFGFGVYSALVLLGVPAALSLFAATVGGVFFNFLTFGAFAFRRLDARRLPRFLVAYALVYAFNVALLHAVRAVTALGPIAAQLACLGVVAPAAYLLLRAKVFAEPAHG